MKLVNIAYLQSLFVTINISNLPKQILFKWMSHSLPKPVPSIPSSSQWFNGFDIISKSTHHYIYVLNT